MNREGLGDRQGGGKVGQTSHQPHSLISVTATFLTISLAFHSRFLHFFHLPYTSRSFLLGVPNSVHLPPHPDLRRLSVRKGEKRKKDKMRINNIRVNMYQDSWQTSTLHHFIKLLLFSLEYIVSGDLLNTKNTLNLLNYFIHSWSIP